jgi:hypothetical protein
MFYEFDTCLYFIDLGYEPLFSPEHFNALRINLNGEAPAGWEGVWGSGDIEGGMRSVSEPVLFSARDIAPGTH